MTEIWKKRISCFVCLLVGLGLIACAAVNPSPAGAPAPVAEVPSAVSFPDNIAVDVSEVGTASAGGLAFQRFEAAKTEVLPIGGEFFDAILFGFNTNQFTDLAVASILTELSSLEIPTNPVTRVFDTQDLLLEQRVKIDFADFNFDNNPDGTTKGCTGCTCPTGCDSVCPTQANFEDLKPVCFRIWRDSDGSGQFIPLMAGFFDQLAIKDNPDTPEDETNPGAGSYRASISFSSVPGEPPELVTKFGANYNHRVLGRPFDQTTEYFNSSSSIFFNPPDVTLSYVKVEQVAIDEVSDESRLLKTIRANNNQPITGDTDPQPSISQYIARYRTDFDYWSGTFQDFLRFPELALTVPPDIDNFTAECAQLTTAIGVEEGTCRDLEIDVSNVPLLELLEPDDPRVNLPLDFPPVPPF